MTSRKRISRAGRPSARRGAAAASEQRPAPAMAGSRRSTAATGAAAPSSAQLRPPNAIALAPTATCAKTTTRPRSRRPAAAADGQRPEHGDVGAGDEQQAPDERLLAQARRLVLELVQQRPAARRSAPSPSRPGRTAAAPWPRADRRRAGRRTRRGAAPRGPRRCCGPSRPRSRAAASGWRARRRPARGAPTTRRRTARPPRRAPPIICTRPPGDEVHVDVHGRARSCPRSNSRATVRSPVSFGSSRWPMPGGRTQASVSRS